MGGGHERREIAALKPSITAAACSLGSGQHQSRDVICFGPPYDRIADSARVNRAGNRQRLR
jgi:hypothetical protein